MDAPVKLATEKFLAYFDIVRVAIQQETGRDLELYKVTDSACVMECFDALFRSPAQGAQFVAELVNTLTWGQCLGNGNHRTTVLFVRTFLEREGVEFPDSAGDDANLAEFEKSLATWVGRSQALIRRRGEPGFAQARLAPKHRKITETWVREELGDQSGALAMIGAQRLMDFISSSEMRG